MIKKSRKIDFIINQKIYWKIKKKETHIIYFIYIDTKNFILFDFFNFKLILF